MSNRAAFVSALVMVMSLAASVEAYAYGAGESNGGETTDSAFGTGVVDGLHLTGTPIEIDRDTYRLAIFGWVEHPLKMSLHEILSMQPTRLAADLVCPGVFRDAGEWTGVRLGDLLEEAGIKAGAVKVVFRSVDGGYEQSLPLQKAMSEGTLISYRFNGKEFDPRNGFPLRLVAKGEPGSVWVKWLGEIEVTGR